MTTLFISDLHLTPSRPDITECFVTFMRTEAKNAEALYVLGDLFEFWVGDDDKTPFANQIRTEFKTLTDQGVPVFFIQGNRDFLLGERFCKETGITLLDDVCTIDLYGSKAVILHGDTLCIDDVKYQKFRKTVHQPWLQWIFKRIPWCLKKKIVSKVQSDIRDDKQMKSLDIMDVNQSEVEKVMSQNCVNLMIHGHTHRPNTHFFDANGAKNTRIVLGDWYTQGSVLQVNSDGFELQNRPFNT
ncbi:TPA: UDP-2,3-diacylglucosamine diphosphatase [Vibrio parahaemolyticus]|uniref:UDP-2,3-diacylglucosamine diphosphatase n=1 Tax=Vibrio parahaemolyticus TaxID=670 RepID=UPI0009B23BA5|nr:UDP-2,3-diacylglucosamine diphosphatase [Vibrio parahaemolyticus]HAS6472350.1 UDP-2,3-diacylglucosamine diphosphatase [Vibrio parahaemolyticus]HAS6475947.1 UDP-2,3-diacylglucosamine diphosphatase [Vibrio parahaemolyticus]